MENKKSLILIIIIAVVFIATVLIFKSFGIRKTEITKSDKNVSNMGVCPPFNLYDEDGNLIDPLNGVNADKPYSPKQTCGKCHDYDKITKGFHFQQGKDEKPTEIMSKRYRWVTSPGNYGGNWCSPAPLYRALAKKKNNSAKEIDMTSYEFVTATCGYCHPGSGPLEFDRDGIRYDKKMKDTGNKFIAGGDNNFDGDYYKASWNETGVIEGDCMLCHLPEYDYKHRNAMLDSLNFKWAATEGSGLGKIEGSIKSKQNVKVTYDLSKFDKDGKVSMHFVREPRNETCLNCHAKPDWKKKGTDFSERRDVHIAAGLKCIDCHGAGSKAPSETIRGKEEHQFGKGDDPS
ncbi:MAG: multiheme c-type cytochrome [Ignavibacteriae bacterium]|nr:multiheme c-type cytochrome [Ignavibacteriota bacterium]